MKTNYTDAELQAAIDEACDKLAQSARVYLNALDLDNTTESWPVEAPARLDLIKSALAALPEPEPPKVDWKTPGQVAWDAGNEVQKRKFPNEPVMSWQEGYELHEQLEAAASAVLAAFGGKEAEHSQQLYHNAMDELREKRLSLIKSRDKINESYGLIEAFVNLWARWPKVSASEMQELCKRSKAFIGVTDQEEPQPAEIPWAEWHGGECPLKDEEVDEWEYKFRQYLNEVTEIARKASSTPNEMVWTHDGSPGDITAYRVLKWKAECGLSQLRSVAEAGPVPEGCVRYHFSKYGDDIGVGTIAKHPSDVLFADIRLPAPAEKPDPYAELKKAHAAGKAIQLRNIKRGREDWKDVSYPAWNNNNEGDEYRIKPEPEPLATKPILPPTWTPKVGDVVTLKSGGPKMTIRAFDRDDPMEAWCHWFKEEKSCAETFPTACLQPA